MPVIYLVRHGITPANKENRFAGRSSVELHAEGIEQSCQVAKRLRSKNIGAIFCGPAKRTLQSAEIIGEILNAPVSILDELDEINIPHWDGLSKDEIRRQFGGQYPTWLSAPQNFNLPGCENLLQVQRRALAGVNRILAGRREQNLLLVSHLIVLRCLVLYYRGLAIRDFRSIKIDNGSIVEVSEEENGRRSLRYLPVTVTDATALK